MHVLLHEFLTFVLNVCVTNVLLPDKYHFIIIHTHTHTNTIGIPKKVLDDNKKASKDTNNDVLVRT